MPFIKLPKSKNVSYIFSALLGILYAQKMILSTWSLLFFKYGFYSQRGKIKNADIYEPQGKKNTNLVILDLNAIKKFRKKYTRAKISQNLLNEAEFILNQKRRLEQDNKSRR